MSLRQLFEDADDEFLEFDRIENPRHPVPDICAFLMLHELAPHEGSGDIVTAAEHDEIFLQTNCAQLEKVATPAQIRDLVRCGIRYSSDNDCLCMFV